MPLGLPPLAVLSLAKRPDLWITAASAGRSLAPDRWWVKRPYLPVPDPGWLRFRLETAYGGAGDAEITGQDLITWLEWKREFPV